MFNDNVLIVLLRRSKTGQEGQGRKVGIPALPHSDSCPVRAARAWLDASGISSHPGFSSMPGGKDAGRFAGHSLRAGFCDSRREWRSIHPRHNEADRPQVAGYRHALYPQSVPLSGLTLPGQ